LLCRTCVESPLVSKPRAQLSIGGFGGWGRGSSFEILPFLYAKRTPTLRVADAAMVVEGESLSKSHAKPPY